jgi:hypothetical protein
MTMIRAYSVVWLPFSAAGWRVGDGMVLAGMTAPCKRGGSGVQGTEGTGHGRDDGEQPYSRPNPTGGMGSMGTSRPAGASREHDTHQLHAMAPRLMGQTIERAGGYKQDATRTAKPPPVECG